MVEQCPFKAWVAGSSPAALTSLSTLWQLTLSASESNRMLSASRISSSGCAMPVVTGFSRILSGRHVGVTENSADESVRGPRSKPATQRAKLLRRADWRLGYVRNGSPGRSRLRIPEGMRKVCAAWRSSSWGDDCRASCNIHSECSVLK